MMGLNRFLHERVRVKLKSGCVKYGTLEYSEPHDAYIIIDWNGKISLYFSVEVTESICVLGEREVEKLIAVVGEDKLKEITDV